MVPGYLKGTLALRKAFALFLLKDCRPGSRVNPAGSRSKASGIQGSYQTISNYDIQKGESQPKLITLTKKSVLRLLNEQAEKLSALLPSQGLTPDELAKAVVYYNQLMAENQHHKLP